MDGSRSDTAATGAAVVGNTLKHHGVKGMKWGVRKGSSSSSSTSSKPAASEDHVVAEGHKAIVKAGGVKALSNKDLKQLNERMQLVQTHRELMGKQPTVFDKGDKHVKKILSTGKKMSEIYNLVNSPAGKAAVKVIKKGVVG